MRTGLQRFAEEHRLLNRQLADAAGITESAISQILAGAVDPRKRTLDRLLAFCRTIDPDISYDALFGADGQQEPAA